MAGAEDEGCPLRSALKAVESFDELWPGLGCAIHGECDHRNLCAEEAMAVIQRNSDRMPSSDD